MNPGLTAIASSISLRLPITEVSPQCTPALLVLPMHFRLAGSDTGVVRSTDLVSEAASATITAGISPELVLVTETSPELEELRKSSVLSTDDKPELVDVNSRSWWSWWSLSDEASSMAEAGKEGRDKRGERERMKGRGRRER